MKLGIMEREHSPHPDPLLKKNGIIHSHLNLVRGSSGSPWLLTTPLSPQRERKIKEKVFLRAREIMEAGIERLLAMAYPLRHCEPLRRSSG
jgi:hypothetical protein